MADVSRLPAPRVADWEWQTGGACRGLDSSTFFHPENERGPSKMRRERQAKEVCARCPVTQRCLQWALETREPYGVWGGRTTEERALMIRLRTAV
ncbi:WhiB family transcriptional regulator [Jatrophihabitans sp. DSM 45814]